MTPIPVNLAVEDELSEAVLRRLLKETGRTYCVGAAYGRGGFGYLRKTIEGWNRAAAGSPFLVLTDLDEYPCPGALIGEWLPRGQHPNLLLRVAVREVESWLLADSTGLARFFGIRPEFVPPAPDTLPDPKAALIALALRARSRDLRLRVAPRPHSTAKQGREYNACLCEFVADGWSVRRAAASSPSLHRAMQRLAAFRPVWPPR